MGAYELPIVMLVTLSVVHCAVMFYARLLWRVVRGVVWLVRRLAKRRVAPAAPLVPITAEEWDV